MCLLCKDNRFSYDMIYNTIRNIRYNVIYDTIYDMIYIIVSIGKFILDSKATRINIVIQ